VPISHPRAILPRLALGGLLACNPPETPPPTGVSVDTWRAWQACDGALPCRTTVLRTTLASNSQMAAALVVHEPSPEARWLLVSGVIQADPARARHLCPALTDAGLKKRCEQDTSRPHLYAPPPSRQTQPNQRTAPGPHSSTLVIHPGAASAHADAPPDPGTCTAGPDYASCLTELARSRAGSGQVASAAGACRAIQGQARWRGECAMRVAETVAHTRPPTEAGSAIEMCLLSEEWVGRCVDKVHLVLARHAPPATADAAGWQPVVQAWQSMSTTWQAQGETLHALAQDAWWATVVTRAYLLVDQTTGDPLDHLPDAATPHIRAAVAWSLLRTSPRSAPSLTEQTDRLDAALTARVTGTRPAARTDPHSPPRGNLWAVDERDDGTIPAAHYLGVSRRIVTDDRSVDLQLCVLEAAARRSTRWHPLVDEAKTAASPLVQRTAARLAAGIQRTGASRRTR